MTRKQKDCGELSRVAAGSRQYKRVLALLAALSVLLLPRVGLSFCHEIEVVKGKIFRVAAANSAPILL